MDTYKTDKLTSMEELWKFCSEYELWLELEKPFKEFDELILQVVDPIEKEVIQKQTVKNILKIEKDAARLLNSLSKVF